ncbi:MAG: hypothetical protein LAO30_22410 [Acidobacteriia bacterium]|nr:hypothetical protein [Terriglobia bacterium]
MDLATIFALSELDVRAVILDQGQLQAATPGKTPIQQMAALTGKQIPYATGLGTPLRYPEDDGLNQFSHYQAGVNLILRVLRESEARVSFMITGSARDVVAAYNRDSELFQRKVAKLYFNDGNSGGGNFQWNPLLDPQAYIRLMTADLPLHWCPAFAKQDTLEDMAAENLKPDPSRVYWKFRQSDIFSALKAPLQNYFLFALGHKDAARVDPIAFLQMPQEERERDDQWKQTRHMWSTASIYDSAGLSLYRKGNSWVASHASVPGFEKTPVYEFVPARISIDRDLRATPDFKGALKQQKVFRLLDVPHYEAAMQSALRQTLSEMVLAQPFRQTPLT